MHFKPKPRPNNKWALYRWESGNSHFVRKEAWPVGLRPNMTIEEARAFCKSLTAQARINAEEASRSKAVTRLLTEEEKQCAWLPIDIVSHFERVHIHPKKEEPGYNKLVSMWKLVRKLIVDVNIDPADWPDEPFPLHNWFYVNPHSSDYVRRCLRMTYKYGRLYCRKRGLAYETPELPSETFMRKISARFKESTKSLPLSLEQLAALSQKLTKEEYQWVRVCFWFGLRPEEADLIAEQTEDYAVLPNGLKIDQPKLRALDKKDRLKIVLAKTAEQKKVLQEIAEGLTMKRPSRKRMENHFPENTTLYGCRHGWTHHMQRLGFKINEISSWLGHRSLATTHRYYQNHGIPYEEKQAS